MLGGHRVEAHVDGGSSGSGSGSCICFREDVDAPAPAAEDCGRQAREQEPSDSSHQGERPGNQRS